ncbi:MAG: DoxX family protein [Candidatus Acidiferrales bacterium]
MIVVIVLAVSLLLFRAAGAFGVTALASWVASTRWALAAMFLFTGAAHFTSARHGMARMVPRVCGNAMAMVYFTGVCEIAGAIGILVPQTRMLAGIGLILLLVAMFPANVKAAREKLNVAGRPATPLAPRTVIQIVFIGLIWWATVLG